MSKLMDDDELGYVYIAEKSNEGYNELSNIEVHDNIPGIFFVEYDQCLQSFDVMNRNHRMYDRSNIEECLKSEKIQSQIAHRGWFMELDHPMQKYKNKPLTPERIQSIDYDRRCAVILDPHMKGNLLVSRIATTPGGLGEGLAKDIVGINYTPMASCRAIANMISRNGKPYVWVKKLITYDTVSYASHREADTLSTPKAIVKKVQAVTESVCDTIEEKVTDIVVPLKEILTNIGHKDVNTQLVLESFALDESDIIGIDDSHTHSIIKAGDNTIYAKVSPEVVNDIDDFFASF